jgi:predicted amidohydrolase
MREPLTLALAQPKCVPYDIEENVRQHAWAIRRARARVVVFPELSLTGYELDAPVVDIADDRLAPLARACVEMGTVALVGAPVAGEAGSSHIATLAASGTGIEVAYRKLCVAESEAKRFSPGVAPAVYEVDGWRFGLGICKDTGVPEHAASTVALGIDAYLAGTLMTTQETGIQNERGRRIAADHRVWVGFASFAGSTGDGYDHAAGCSAIWGPGGEVAAQTGPEPGAITRATLR